MHLSWLGLSSFKMETKDAVLVMDPYGPKVSNKPLRAKADIVTVSRFGDSIHGHIDAIQGEPFVIDHPGEFELKGIFIQGAEVPLKDEKKSSTIFWMDVEGMRIAHLGNLETVPDTKVMEKMDGMEVDVLMVPVGGVGLELKQIIKVVNDIEPRIVIPMHYAQDGVNVGTKLAPVSGFLKEMGASGVKPIDRMLFKKKDLPTAEDTQVVLFTV